MANVGIFFGTDTGYTRKAAKSMAKQLGKTLVPDKPLNINRTTVAEFISYDALILGTPTYGDGQLPGKSAGLEEESWAEFLPRLQGKNLSGKIVALYGFGNQKKYGEHYVNAMGLLYEAVTALGANVIGAWPIDGYEFEHSGAVREGRFVGLALDDKNQAMLTPERVAQWLALIKPEFVE